MTDYIKYTRLLCDYCLKESFLTKQEYDMEMNDCDSTWLCKNCGELEADFDDDYWENNVGANK